MQLMPLLHSQLEKELPFIHKARMNSLMQACQALINSNTLTLTALGRNFSNENKVQSNIKKSARLLGNPRLHRERLSFYKAMNNYVFQEGLRPWIHIDWSCLCPTTELYLLRASLSMQSRAIVIYEECHSHKMHNNYKAHKAFLDKLKELLPSHCNPIIVTDAGFKSNWFTYVKKLGWDFVGRVRFAVKIKLDGELQ